MKVYELMLILGELELSDKTDAEVEMYCDGYVFNIAGVYRGKHGSILIGDSEAESNIYIEPVKAHGAHKITVTRGLNDK